MALEKSSAINNGEENEDAILQKTLNVINMPSHGYYVPGINIKGKYLKKYGFNTGDKVFVQVAENRILIEKILESELGLD